MFITYLFIGLVVYCLPLGIVTYLIAKNKGDDDATAWFLWGFLFGIFAVIVAISKPSKVAVKVENTEEQKKHEGTDSKDQSIDISNMSREDAAANGEAYLKLGQFDKAESIFKSLMELYPAKKAYALNYIEAATRQYNEEKIYKLVEAEQIGKIENVIKQIETLNAADNDDFGAEKILEIKNKITNARIRIANERREREEARRKQLEYEQIKLEAERKAREEKHKKAVKRNKKIVLVIAATVALGISGKSIAIYYEVKNASENGKFKLYQVFEKYKDFPIEKIRNKIIDKLVPDIYEESLVLVGEGKYNRAYDYISLINQYKGDYKNTEFLFNFIEEAKNDGCIVPAILEFVGTEYDAEFDSIVGKDRKDISLPLKIYDSLECVETCYVEKIVDVKDGITLEIYPSEYSVKELGAFLQKKIEYEYGDASENPEYPEYLLWDGEPDIYIKYLKDGILINVTHSSGGYVITTEK